MKQKTIMKNSNTTIAACAYKVLMVSAFVIALFSVLPVEYGINADVQVSHFGTEVASAQYDYGSNYYSGGDIGAGCCDSYFDYGNSYSDYGSSYDYGSNYYSGGDIGAGCCDYYMYDYAPITYSSYDYGSNYYSGGDVGAGCCDNYTEPFQSPSDTTPYDYGSNYYSGGDIGAGCCDNYTYEPNYPEYPNYDIPYEQVPFDEPSVVTSYPDDYDFFIEYPDYGGYTSYGYSTPYTYSYSPVSYGYNTYSYNGPTYSYNPPTFEDRPTCTLDISPNVIEKGENATIRWNTDDARTVTISDGIGSVDDDGSRTISPNSSRTYVLVASGPGGTVSCSDSITVEDEDDNDDNDRDVRCDAFTVSDDEVEKGDKVTLEWRTTGANDVDINQSVGDVEDDGSERVTITRDTTFKLTARNGSETDTCTVEVEVEDEDDEDEPRCELKVSDRTVEKNDSVRLSWDNDRTDRVVLKDNHGKEIADSRDDRNIDDDKDSVSVRVTRDTKYTLTTYNGSEKDICTVEVELEDKKKDVTVTSVRSQDTITLSQVPYTGFEAGPVLTFIFYAAIVIWGVVVGYILVLKGKAGALVATGASALTGGAVLPTTAVIASTHSPENSVVEIPFNLPTAQEIVEEPEFEETDPRDSIKSLEQHAHESYTLLSSDALRFIASQADSFDEQVATLDHVIALAKARFPKEGDWMVLNKERVISILS